jgi:hypothetical protein
MKITLSLLFLVIVTFSCKKASDNMIIPVDDNKIISQVKQVVDTVFQGCEDVNPTMVLGSCYNSPGFVYVFNGRTLNFQDFSESLTAVFDILSDQEISRFEEKYTVLDHSTVLYTTNCVFLQHYKDGQTKLIDPAVMMFIFQKINKRWQWIYGVESYGKNAYSDAAD